MAAVDWNVLEQSLDEISAGDAAYEFQGMAPYWLNDNCRELLRAIHPDYAYWRERPPLPHEPGGCWIVLVSDSSTHALLRTGVVLPLQWEQNADDDSHLPESVRNLARDVVSALNDVVGEVAASDWGLRMWSATGKCPNLGELQSIGADSGWASLAGGLLVLATGGRQRCDVWATGRWSSDEKGELSFATIDGLRPKIEAAVDWQVKEFFVPSNQVNEAKQIAADFGAAISIGELVTSERNPGVALGPYHASLRIAPDDSEEVIVHGRHFLELLRDDRNKANGYYDQVVLPKVIERCRAELQPGEDSITHLVTVVSGSPELVRLAARVLRISDCLLLYTEENEDAAERLEEELRNQVGVEHVARQAFGYPESMAADFERHVGEFAAGVAQRLAYDLTPGKKDMSVTLALHIARPGQRLIYLRHDWDWQAKRVVPGTETFALWRSGDADSTDANEVSSPEQVGNRIRLDLSLSNVELYDGCRIEEVAGRLNLTTPVSEAINIVGRNIERMVAAVAPEQRDECVLTGGMAIWAYLVVFHAVVHRFTKVLYDDGRTGPVLIAKHG